MKRTCSKPDQVNRKLFTDLKADRMTAINTVVSEDQQTPYITGFAFMPDE